MTDAMTRVRAIVLAACAALPLSASAATGGSPAAAPPAAPPPAAALAGGSPGGDPVSGPESILRAVPTPESFGRHLRLLAARPHPAGSARNMELADYVRDRFKEYGLERVHFHDTPALLAVARTAAVEIVAPVSLRLRLKEAPIEGDPYSRMYDDPAAVPFHAYAADGDVTTEVVYANSGGPEDFERLEAMGIDVRGRIVVMRYSEPYSYRGYKVYMAESRGAAGVIIYSDPADDGFARGDTWPDGPWGPPSHLQLGSIVYDWLGPGEPFTFHWRRRRNGTWVEGRERDPKLPRIPSLPVSWEDAAEILSRLRGPAVPAGWQGGMPFTYHTGPGPVRLRLRVDNDERVLPLRNVIGSIRGAVEPDRRVVIGNHRDAWTYGAVDPSSGTAALLEVARALGEALRQGHRPRRTIVLANWDAEEDLLGGSTSWVKDESARLLRDGVAYINVDYAAGGPDFQGGATPELAEFLIEATRAVDDPARGGSLYDGWAARFDGCTPRVDPIVGATDYTAFLEHLGMSCIDMLFDGPYGVYHSQYDNPAWLERAGDPGFAYNTAMARLWGIVAWRLADADILPLRYSGYAVAMPALLDAAAAKAAVSGRATSPCDGATDGNGSGSAPAFGAARAAAARWEQAARLFEGRLDGRRAAGRAIPPDRMRTINDLLMQASRAMTDDEGLAGRPFFRHLIYAPRPTYRPEYLPRIEEAIDGGRRDDLPRLEAGLAAAFDRVASLLQRAADELQGDAGDQDGRSTSQHEESR